jgi:ABC-type Na+ efflux pump permease subunit
VNWTSINAIIRKDVTTVLRNKGVRTPLLVAPIIILIVLPTFLILGGEVLASSSQVPVGADGSTPFDQLANTANTGVTGIDVNAPGGWERFVLEVFIAPLYLLVPLMVATVIAADSFAGERERKTLEALLHSPTSDDELLVAKVLAAWVPAVVIGVGGFLVYCVVANVVAWPQFGRIFFPTPTWVLLGLWVTPGVAALGLGTMVIVSSRVDSLQAAHQIGSLIVLPVILLLIVQVSGALLFNPVRVAVLGLIIWTAAGIVLRVAAQYFRREQLAVRL